jgi:hypothetical protein
MTYGSDGFGITDHEDFSFENEDEGEGYNDMFDAPAPGRAMVPIDSETAAQLMNMYADMAAEADSEEEADAFLPLIASLAPMAFKALKPLAGKVFAKLAPKLSQGVLGAGRAMVQKVGQEAIKDLPVIARGVARDTLQRVAKGQNVTGDMVLRSAAQHTLPYLQDPQTGQPVAQPQSQSQPQRRPRRGGGGCQPARVPQWCC